MMAIPAPLIAKTKMIIERRYALPGAMKAGSVRTSARRRKKHTSAQTMSSSRASI